MLTLFGSAGRLVIEERANGREKSIVSNILQNHHSPFCLIPKRDLLYQLMYGGQFMDQNWIGCFYIPVL
jgi:hypothetical protein